MLTNEQLTTELLDPIYAGLTADQKAALFNDANIELHDAVETSVAQDHVMDTASSTPPLTLYMKLLAIYRDEAYPLLVRVAAENAIDLVFGATKQLELHNNPRYAQVLAVLVHAQDMFYAPAQVWTQAEADGVLNLGKRMISRAVQLGGDGFTVTAAQIRALELQPQRDAVAALQEHARNGHNAVQSQLGNLLLSLDAGTDVTLPAWADLVTTYQNAPATEGP